MNNPSGEIRKYLGRHKIQILFSKNNKALIKHLEQGKVGNSKCGYKEVNSEDIDICPIRLCWKLK